jgi:thioesterase domain-containing protein
MDHQVKLRGYRIELGEIEAALETHAGVQQAIAVITDEGEQRLVAYVVCREGSERLEAGLKQHVRDRLPAYMTPSAIVELDALPLNVNGKVDRGALPSSGFSSRPQAGLVGPRDSIECQLTLIWEELLRVRPIGIHDNFFELGGHSMLALRLFTRIEELLGVRLPIATLFEGPTIEQLASVVRQRGRKAKWSSLVAIRPTGKHAPLFCVHGVGGNVLSFRHLARNLGPDYPVYALQAQGLDGSQPLRTVEAMAAHYIAEIRSVQPEGPYQLAGLCFGGVVAYEMAHQINAAGDEVSLLALIDTAPPIVTRYSSLVRSIGAFAAFQGERIRLHWRAFFALDPGQRLDHLKRKLRTLNHRIRRNGRQLSQPVRQTPLPQDVTDQNLAALKMYTPISYDGPAVLFRPQDRGMQPGLDDSLGWGSLIRERLEIRDVTGAHDSIMGEPHVAMLAGMMREYLIERGASVTSVRQ